MERVCADLQNGWGSPEYRRQLADHLIAELVRHCVTTEQYLYPLARKNLPHSEKLLDQHEAGEKVLRAKEAASIYPHPSAPERLATVHAPPPGTSIIDEVKAAMNAES